MSNKYQDEKALALKYCMDIATAYTEEEVQKFCLYPVLNAWKVGRAVLDKELKISRDKLKDFKI